MSGRYKDHGYAAFAPEDVEDARRGRPAVSLQEYAQARGLEFHGRGRLAGFTMALPPFGELQHNLMRGILPGGRFGVLLHQLVQTHGSDGHSLTGTFHRVRTTGVGGLGGVLRSLKPDRHSIPVIGDWLNPTQDDSPREAFDTPGAWAPATTVATPVPETVAGLERLLVISKSRAARFSLAGGPSAQADGFRVDAAAGADPAALQAVLDGPARPVLDRLAALAYAELRVDHGMLTLRRGGYLTDPAALDAFAQDACALADALAAAFGPAGPVPAFAEPLPACPWATDDRQATEPGVAGAWARDFRTYAAERSMVLEDPAAFHAAHGALPVPGRVLAVMRNPRGGRVLFTTDVPLRVSRAVRGVVAFAAAPGTPDTAPGGIRPDGTGMTCSVTAGVALAWTHRWYGYGHEAGDLIQQAMAAAAAAGITPG
jgi:hypothetical protein